MKAPVYYKPGELGPPAPIVEVYRLTDHGDLPDGITMEGIGQANAIIYGSPTYMGGPAWQFKKFADACSKLFERQAWKNKLASQVTKSASVSGDKFATITYSGRWRCRCGRSG